MLRRLRQLCPDHLWTFTKRGKFPTRAETWEAYGRFCALWRRWFPNRPWVGVEVPELHADGQGWHIHVGIRGFVDVRMVRRVWFKALGGTGSECADQTPGNVDVEGPRRRFRHAKLALYLCKYMQKSFVEAGATPGKLFDSSRSIDRPEIRRWRQPIALGVDTATYVARQFMPGYAPTNWTYGGSRGFSVDNNVWQAKKRGVDDG